MSDEPEAKCGRGRPPHEPTDATRKLVKWAAFDKLTHPEIAEMIGISKDTLYAHYSEEIQFKREIMIADLKESGLMQAVGGPTRDWEKAKPNVTMFYLERMAGVTQPTKIEQVMTIKIGGEFEGV